MVDGKSVNTHCIMSGDGAWTQVHSTGSVRFAPRLLMLRLKHVSQAATVSSDGKAWQYTDQHGDQGMHAHVCLRSRWVGICFVLALSGQRDGPWESTSVFGNAKDNKDFKSVVFSKSPKDQIMVCELLRSERCNSVAYPTLCVRMACIIRRLYADHVPKRGRCCATRAHHGCLYCGQDAAENIQ